MKKAYTIIECAGTLLILAKGACELVEQITEFVSDVKSKRIEK